MAYVEPNVAVYPTLHMPVHSEGGWQHKYSIHKYTLSIHTHRAAVLISEVSVLEAGRAPAAVFRSQRSHLSVENN